MQIGQRLKRAFSRLSQYGSRTKTPVSRQNFISTKWDLTKSAIEQNQEWKAHENT